MGLGRVPTNDGEGFFDAAGFKCFGKGVWYREGPTNDDEGFSVSADLKCFMKGPTNDYE